MYNKGHDTEEIIQRKLVELQTIWIGRWKKSIICFGNCHVVHLCTDEKLCRAPPRGDQCYSRDHDTLRMRRRWRWRCSVINCLKALLRASTDITNITCAAAPPSSTRGQWTFASRATLPKMPLLHLNSSAAGS